MALIEDLIETAAVEITGTRHRRLGSHDKTPALSGSVPRDRHFTMLREDEESFNLNQLWVVQGRLLIVLLEYSRC
jgi:cytochrome oxidase Cu insertion factor (SCO1/SenC/PrrC family)